MSKSLKNTLSKVILLAAAVALVPQVASARGGMGGGHVASSAQIKRAPAHTPKATTYTKASGPTTVFGNTQPVSTLPPAVSKFPVNTTVYGNKPVSTTKLPTAINKLPINTTVYGKLPVSSSPTSPTQPTCPTGNCGFGGGFPVGFGLGYGLGTFAGYGGYGAGYGGYGAGYGGYGSYAPVTAASAAPIVADASTTTTDATASSSPTTAPAPSGASTAATPTNVAPANAVLTALLTAAH